MGTDIEDTEEELDEASLPEEQLNVVREDCDNIAKERDSSVLEVEHMETDRETTGEARHDAALLDKSRISESSARTPRH
jgi:hypothetical protein